MRDLLILAVHLLVTFAKLCGRGGVRAVAAESLLLKQQLLISNRSGQRAPNLTTLDRFVLGFTTLFVSQRRIERVAALLSPATLFKFHTESRRRNARGHRHLHPPPSVDISGESIAEVCFRHQFRHDCEFATHTFDGPGIPPDIAVPVFADEDLAAGRDPGLERAMTELH